MQRNGTLRIGLDGDTLGRKRTGDESYLTSLMRGLSRIDTDSEYRVYVRDVENASRLFASPDRFHFQRVRPNSIWLRFPFGLPIVLRRDPVDILHVQYFAPPMTACPTVLTVHDISFAVRPDFFTYRDRLMLGSLVPWSLRRVDRIITDTEFTRREMVNVYDLDPNRIAVIPLAADPKYKQLDRDKCRDQVSRRHNAPDGFILYVGTLQPRKNVSTLIKAYALFRQESGLPHKLLIVGKPKYMFRSVFAAIADSGYEDDIVFTGFVDDADLPAYYNAADAFVFPSWYEGFGLPVVEAMACGTPTICSNASCIPEVAGDGAITADPSDPESFCNALISVLSDPAAAKQLADRGIERAHSFSWDRTATETLEVYRQVADRSNGK